MSAIYIISEHGKLSKESEKLVFEHPDGTRQILFPFKMEMLVFLGNASISGAAFKMLSKYKIPTVFLARNGHFNGRLVYGQSKNVFLRQKQYLHSANPQKSLEISRAIVAGKIRNQISFMQRIKRKKGMGNEIEEAVQKMRNLLKDAESAQNVAALRGYEGNASRTYFSVFRFNLIPEWASFPKRTRNPPETNVNAVMSFLYTLLLYRVEAAVESTGLDTMAGNLHAMEYGSNSLVFDLMEEFRIPIADSVCCSLFNLGQLKVDDFRQETFSTDSEEFPIDVDETDTVTEKKGVLLTDEGMKKTVSAFENKMHTLVYYQPENTQRTYQEIIFEQAEQYKRYISGEQKGYVCYYGK